MGKHINIIARTNGVGLDSDVVIIRNVLESAGYTVTFSHCRSKSIFYRLSNIFSKKYLFDVNIFLERVFPNWIPAAKTNLLIPNQERFPKRHISRLKKIDHVLCKSQHAQEIFSRYHSSSHYIGFTSKDTRLSEITPNYNMVFHLAGKSTLKGTETILELWKENPHWPVLNIVQHQDNAPPIDSIPANVNLIANYLSSEELYQLSNTCGIHLCPSLSEGWGHYIVEAMSSCAVVITTDAPPMNELISSDRGILTPVSHSEPRHIGTNFYVEKDALRANIEKAISMSNNDKVLIGKLARDWYLENQTRFTQKFLETLKTIL
jgi:glycosyltransferase involved in cell wall biosynthesis